MQDSSRVAVLLFNLGGPETQDDVEPFLVNLFSDPDIMDLPPLLGKFLPRLIARRRAPKSRGYYAAIGGGSPLRSITEDQARLLEEGLNEGQSERTFRVFLAMRYAPPRLSQIISPLLSFRPDRLVLLPLYPQRSTTTTRSSFREFKALLAGTLALSGDRMHVVTAFPDYPPYIEALGETVMKAIEALPDNGHPVDILFSAHGIPESRIRKGDPYQLDTETTVRAVSRYLEKLVSGRALRIHLAYQSRVGPLKWLGPETKKTIVDLAARSRCVNLVLVPVSFVSDHQETLYEMDITYRDLAKSSRILHFERAPALNIQPSFIRALARLTEEAISNHQTAGAPCSCRCGVCPEM